MIQSLTDTYSDTAIEMDLLPTSTQAPTAIELGRSYCGLHQLSEIQVSLSHIIGEPNIIFSVFDAFSDKYDN
jgi:hypothetical protein